MTLTSLWFYTHPILYDLICSRHFVQVIYLRVNAPSNTEMSTSGAIAAIPPAEMERCEGIAVVLSGVVVLRYLVCGVCNACL